MSARYSGQLVRAISFGKHTPSYEWSTWSSKSSLFMSFLSFKLLIFLSSSSWIKPSCFASIQPVCPRWWQYLVNWRRTQYSQCYWSTCFMMFGYPDLKLTMASRASSILAFASVITALMNFWSTALKDASRSRAQLLQTTKFWKTSQMSRTSLQTSLCTTGPKQQTCCSLRPHLRMSPFFIKSYKKFQSSSPSSLRSIASLIELFRMISDSGATRPSSQCSTQAALTSSK